MQHGHGLSIRASCSLARARLAAMSGTAASPAPAVGEERSWPVPALPRRGLLASLDGDPGGREDQGRRDGDQRFQPCKPHHPDHSFGKSGDRRRHGAGRGRTRHEPGRLLEERRGHRGRSFAGHLGPERRGGRSEPAPHQAVAQPLPPAGQAALDRPDRAAEPCAASS